MNPFFKLDSYDTPTDTQRALLDRLSFGSRAYFIFEYLRQVVKSASLAKKGLYDKKAWEESSFQIIKNIESCGGRIHIRNMDILSQCKGPVVFISNHMSMLETFAFPCIISPSCKVTFVVKESLTNHPFFGPVMRSREPIVVRRKNPREDFETVMTKGKETLDKGISVIIFPQSTRSSTFNPAEFNTLGIKLAKAAGVQVMPIAIKTDFWKNGNKYMKDFGGINRMRPIHIEFGDLMTIQGNGKEEHKKIIEFIENNLQKWKAEDEILNHL